MRHINAAFRTSLATILLLLLSMILFRNTVYKEKGSIS